MARFLDHRKPLVIIHYQLLFKNIFLVSIRKKQMTKQNSKAIYYIPVKGAKLNIPGQPHPVCDIHLLCLQVAYVSG
jgi:hypothetical protein